jgi:hypothetical protein
VRRRGRPLAVMAPPLTARSLCPYSGGFQIT